MLYILAFAHLKQTENYKDARLTYEKQTNKQTSFYILHIGMKQQFIAQKLPKIKALIELQTYLELGCLKTQDSRSSREQSPNCWK